MQLGIDYIGGVNYWRQICKYHPADFAAGFLVKASGWRNGLRAVRKLAKTGKCSTMRLHGIWHDNHKFASADIKPAVKIAKKITKLANKFPDIKFYYSPWLEHNNAAAFAVCYERCRVVLPACIEIVSSGPSEVGILEVHHAASTAGRYIFSFDGLDMQTVDVKQQKRQHRDALIFFGWIPQCNGKKTVSDSTPRNKRKAWLERDHFKKIKQLLKA